SKIITLIINLSFTAILFSIVVVYYYILLHVNFSSNLPMIGVIHQNALKKSNKALRLDKQEYISIPSSFLAFLAGLVDGDGYIQVTKTSKGFIAIKLVISLHLEDLSILEYIHSILEYIHSVLKIGKINIYKDLRSPTCKLVINKTFNLAIYIFKNNIKIYNQIPDNAPTIFEIPKNPIDYALLPFFKNWIVGFTYSKGSFFIKSNNNSYFQLKQRIHTNLFEAFKLIFNTNRKIDTTNNFNQFSISSKSNIQKVINFFSFSGLHPLVGLKYIQYIK
nr:cob gene intronic ORF [Neurospora crassa]